MLFALALPGAAAAATPGDRLESPVAAYADEFTHEEDVCLVVKDFFYGGEAAADVRDLRRVPGSPEILYSYTDLDPAELPGLSTACDCYVHPYRGEGFGLPIVEAMACGLPVIVTGRGAALDFCEEDLAYLVPAEVVPVPRDLWDDRLPTVQPPTWLEPDKLALRRLMRHVLENHQEAARKGALASARVLERYTWQRTVDAMVRHMDRFRPIGPQPGFLMRLG